MKLYILALLMAPLVACAAPPPGYCEVTVCNKLERLTMNPWKMLKDSAGETCRTAVLGKVDAVVGKKLSSSSRWYQGSFNPTKSSVTRVKAVRTCTGEAAADSMQRSGAIQNEPQKALEHRSATPSPPAMKAPASASAATDIKTK